MTTTVPEKPPSDARWRAPVPLRPVTSVMEEPVKEKPGWRTTSLSGADVAAVWVAVAASVTVMLWVPCVRELVENDAAPVALRAALPIGVAPS